MMSLHRLKFAFEKDSLICLNILQICCIRLGDFLEKILITYSWISEGRSCCRIRDSNFKGFQYIWVTFKLKKWSPVWNYSILIVNLWCSWKSQEFSRLNLYLAIIGIWICLNHWGNSMLLSKLIIKSLIVILWAKLNLDVETWQHIIKIVYLTD